MNAAQVGRVLARLARKDVTTSFRTILGKDRKVV